MQGLRKVSSGSYFDLIVAAPAQKQYYLVWVRYGTGDSFHQNDGRISFVHLCKSRADAEFLTSKLKMIKGHKTVTLPSGDKVSVSPDWEGYFESFEGAEYEQFDLR